MLALLIFVVAVALVFDFLNGMNDAANSVATVVSTRVLPPLLAVAWAAFFNFVAFALLGTAVAKTIGEDIVDPAFMKDAGLSVVLAGLLGSIAWVWGCTWKGLPISVSHSLVGGLAGAAWARGGFDVLVGKGFTKVGIGIVASPVLGLLLGFALLVACYWLCRSWRPGTVNWVFRKVQLVSAALYSLSHGSNDAQKTMGIIAVAVYVAGYSHGVEVPLWIVLSCHGAIALGTLTGGWRVIRTLGLELTSLKPIGGACAESAAGSCILVASGLGVPVSTTHSITGAIMGVGSVVRFSAVRWGIARKIVAAWVLTIPGAWFGAALAMWGLDAVGLR